MKSMPIADLEDFFASPEFEDAFNRWRAKYTAAAMVDLSPTALEPFPSVVPLRVCRDCDSPFSPRKATHVLCDVCVWSALEMAWSLAEPDFFDGVSEFTESHDPYQQASTPPNYIKDSPLMDLIEQSDTE